MFFPGWVWWVHRARQTIKYWKWKADRLVKPFDWHLHIKNCCRLYLRTYSMHFMNFMIKTLQVSPNEIIHPDTFNIQEIHLLLRPNATGVVTCMISAIGMWLVIGTKLISYVIHTDPIDHTLLEAWLVTCTCKEPTITKVLNTNLPASYNKPIVKVFS